MTTTSQPDDRRVDVARGPGSDLHGNETGVSSAETADAEWIARRAYERFLARGGEHGRDQERQPGVSAPACPRCQTVMVATTRAPRRHGGGAVPTGGPPPQLAIWRCDKCGIERPRFE